MAAILPGPAPAAPPQRKGRGAEPSKSRGPLFFVSLAVTSAAAFLTLAAAAPSLGPCSCRSPAPVPAPAPRRPVPAPKPPGVLLLQCGSGMYDRWYGRLGNNVISVFNAALRAEVLGLRFAAQNCSHPVLNLAPYDYAALKGSPPVVDALYPGEAFHTFISADAGLILPLSACCRRRALLGPLLKRFTTSPAAFKYPPDALIIHIRSGDIFDTGGEVHPLYGPPPLAYYQAVIEDHRKRVGGPVVVVTEASNMSPLVLALLVAHPALRLQAGALEEDVAVVLAARHLVVSQGTFAWALGAAAPALRTLYTFACTFDTRPFCDVDAVEFSAPEFQMGAWEASEEQVRYLMDFPRAGLRRTARAARAGACEGAEGAEAAGQRG